VQKLLREADQRAYDHLVTHREDLDRLVTALLQREELLRDEIEAILGKKELPIADGQQQNAIQSAEQPVGQPVSK
jgi:ATP-dependent Zn protease